MAKSMDSQIRANSHIRLTKTVVGKYFLFYQNVTFSDDRIEAQSGPFMPAVSFFSIHNCIIKKLIHETVIARLTRLRPTGDSSVAMRNEYLHFTENGASLTNSKQTKSRVRKTKLKTDF
jgi:hypothetical protein